LAACGCAMALRKNRLTAAVSRRAARRKSIVCPRLSNRPIEIRPASLHPNGGFVHPPGAVAHSQMRADPLFKLRCVGLDPSEDRRVVDLDAAIEQHELQITIADGKHQNHRTAQRITSAVNCRPLKELPRPTLTPARSFPPQSYRNSVSSEVCNRTVVFAERVRTAIGAFGGTLKDVPAPDLGAVAIRAAVERAGLKPDEIETAAMGNVVQAGAKMNPARQAAVQAGLPVTVPAMTVNRVCGSGAQAIVSAAQEILLGNANAAVAGGMENMDQAPYLVQRGRWGYRLGDGQLYDSVLRDGLNDAFSSYRYKSRHFLDKIRNLYQYSYCRNRLTRSQPGEESSRLFENLTGPQPRARAEGRRRFPYFYRP
jgi:Thiolase, N-terminal domain